ncbi:hypothetical protein QTH90_21095 [Variovorax sp. J2P1-59]|uniref:hypothetical protein n=1 Tax=Variovorax flavidus TaxID=3053501 RepID=UPI00257887C8|nr:hypothetical protein [Variovorax sp. J2P1-59]MDM0076919.1 hypothetical protein [Variovorax sp. J2P1-59]
MTTRISSVALHESAHAVIAWIFRATVNRIEVGANPCCIYSKDLMAVEVHDPEELVHVMRERLILIALAGDAGEGIPHRGHGPDHARAWGLITEDTPGFYARARLDWLMWLSRELVERHREAVNRVAVALDVRGSLNRGEFLKLVASDQHRST